MPRPLVIVATRSSTRVPARAGEWSVDVLPVGGFLTSPSSPFALAAACLLSQSAIAATPYERAVLGALNAVRSDPPRYTEQLRRYRGFFHANVVLFPGSRVRHRTNEGVAPVDEAMAFVSHAAPLAPFQASVSLETAAAGHVREQAATGSVGHSDRTGGTPGERIAAVGGRGAVSEVIEYGATDPEDVIRQLVVDDGVPDRGHRVVLFATEIRYAGVACGPHPVYRTMCVIDFAGWVNDPTHPVASLVARAEDTSFVRSMTRVINGLALRERLRSAHRLVGHVDYPVTGQRR